MTETKRESGGAAKTLRDEFAMAALTGLVTRRSDLSVVDAARIAGAYADAMMAERRKP